MTKPTSHQQQQQQQQKPARLQKLNIYFYRENKYRILMELILQTLLQWSVKDHWKYSFTISFMVANILLTRNFSYNLRVHPNGIKP